MDSLSGTISSYRLGWIGKAILTCTQVIYFELRGSELHLVHALFFWSHSDEYGHHYACVQIWGSCQPEESWMSLMSYPCHSWGWTPERDVWLQRKSAIPFPKGIYLWPQECCRLCPSPHTKLCWGWNLRVQRTVTEPQ